MNETKKLKIGFALATNAADADSYKPLSFGYLKAYLDSFRHGLFEMDFLDADFEPQKYDILAISSTSQDYNSAIKIAERAKEINPGIITIIGGHHITYLPETMKPCFDIGVAGEGEATFLDIFDNINGSEKVLNKADLAKIKGIVLHDGDGIIKADRRPLIVPLDAIPHPFHFKGKSHYLFTSRGCPYRCAFCGSSAFWGKTRMFSAGYVVEEIERTLHDFPETEYIPIQDDLFVANRQRLEEIIKLLESRGIINKVSFTMSVHANLVDEELCGLLKKFRLKFVCFGAESGSDRLLKIIGKNTTVEQNQRALNLLKKSGIETVCSFIVGIPGETESETISTFEFIWKNIRDIKLSTISAVNILTPMPGTAIWNEAVSQGSISLENFDWNRLSGFASYRASKASGFDEWVSNRKRNNSIYLNEETLPYEKLIEIMRSYENKITKFEKSRRWNPARIARRISRLFSAS
jgi:anaerobic magnesium-protoporphyrin IX monomethyl ester cyclase